MFDAWLICKGDIFSRLETWEVLCGGWAYKCEDVWRRICAASTISDRQKEDGTLVGMRRSFGLAMRHEDTSTLPIPCSREGTPTFPG